MNSRRLAPDALPASVRLDEGGPMPSLRFQLFDQVSFMNHAVTTRLGGDSRGAYASANLGLSVGDERHAVLSNRALAGRLVSDSGRHPATARQRHGVVALYVEDPGEPGVPSGDGDMLATNVPDVPLLVQAADCVPLIVADPVRRAVAVVHAGWRGTALGAAREAVGSMNGLFGSMPGDLLVALGPAIGGCCYEVSQAVAEAVAASCVPRADCVVLAGQGDRPHVDLVAALIGQLRSAGVAPQHIASAGICTACRTDLLYSHRREGEPTGRFGALVSIAR